MTRTVAVPVLPDRLMITTAANAIIRAALEIPAAWDRNLTISAATLEQGHAASRLWYEYSRLAGLSDAQLIQRPASTFTPTVSRPSRAPWPHLRTASPTI